MGLKLDLDNIALGPRHGSYPKNRWNASLFYDLGGLDAGATVHFVGQMDDDSVVAWALKVAKFANGQHLI